AGLFEVLGLDDNMLIHWNEVLALDHEFGHWIFSCWIFQRPYPCQLLSAGVVNGSVAPKRLETEFGEAFLKGGLIRNVALKRVIADAADRRELIDHQSDRRVVGSAPVGLVLADLTAGFDDRMGDAGRIAGARIDDDERVTEAAAMGAFSFGHE